MKRDRLQELIEAYGADRSRWPEAERALFEKIAPDDPALVASRRLDTLLSRFEAPAPNPMLAQRIVASAAGLRQESAPASRRPRLPRRLPAFRLPLLGIPWPEIAAMAAALVLGFYIGVNSIGYGTSTDELAASTFGDAGLTLSASQPPGLFQSGVFQ